MTPSMAPSMDLTTAGFKELSGDELVQFNGGGFWAWAVRVGGALVRAATWEVLVLSIIINTLWDPADAWYDFWEGVDDFMYET